MEAVMAQSSKAMLRKSGRLGEFTDLLASVKHMFDGYHPERHYMRGPGPAWHAKHAAAHLRLSDQTQRGTNRGQRNVAGPRGLDLGPMLRTPDVSPRRGKRCHCR